MQISEADIRIVKRLGAGASSVVFKGFLSKENRFVAVKKINVFERVRGGPCTCMHMHAPGTCMRAGCKQSSDHII